MAQAVTFSAFGAENPRFSSRLSPLPVLVPRCALMTTFGLASPAQFPGQRKRPGEFPGLSLRFISNPDGHLCCPLKWNGFVFAEELERLLHLQIFNGLRSGRFRGRFRFLSWWFGCRVVVISGKFVR